MGIYSHFSIDEIHFIIRFEARERGFQASPANDEDIPLQE
jgi:hypothetical protein